MRSRDVSPAQAAAERTFDEVRRAGRNLNRARPGLGDRLLARAQQAMRDALVTSIGDDYGSTYVRPSTDPDPATARAARVRAIADDGSEVQHRRWSA